VITPLTPKGLEALVPQPPPPNQPPPPPDQDRTVVIVIDKNGNYKLNQDDILKDQMEQRLIDIFKTRAERVVFVKGDPDVEFQHVATAIDIAKSAGLDKVGLMTKGVESGQ
jgi:biopolymer transport protein ExbD